MLGQSTCRFLARRNDRAASVRSSPLSELENLFEQGNEIARSLWDDNALIADLDLEYVNFDRPEEAFLDPERAFASSGARAGDDCALLAGYGIAPLHLLSGRGHHFVWRVAQNSPAFHRLARSAVSPTLWTRP